MDTTTVRIMSYLATTLLIMTIFIPLNKDDITYNEIIHE